MLKNKIKWQKRRRLVLASSIIICIIFFITNPAFARGKQRYKRKERGLKTDVRETKPLANLTQADFAGALVAFKYIDELCPKYNLSADDYLNKMKEAGIKYLRLIDVPPTERMKELVRKLKEMGFEMMPTLSISRTDFDERIDEAVNNQDWSKVKDLIREEFYKKELTPKVEAHKDYIKYWQVWNEENGGEKFGLNRIAYSLLLTGKARTDAGGLVSFNNETINIGNNFYSLEHGASGLIKQICPDCKVVLGGLAGAASDPEYQQYLYRNNVLDYIDIIDFHANFNPERPKTKQGAFKAGYAQYWTKLSCGVLNVNRYLCGGRCEKPIWVTEIGATSNFKYVETDQSNNPTGYSMSATMEFQADDVIKRYICALALGIEKGFWNQFYDHSKSKTIYKGGKGGKQVSCPSQMTDGFYTTNISQCKSNYKGLIWNGLQEKPSFTAYKLLTQKLAGVKKVERINNWEEDIFVFRATFKDGSKKFIAWCEPFLNDDFTQTKAWSYEDKDCSKIIDLSKEFMGTVKITKRDGSRQEAPANSMPISQSPVFIEKIL